jgi:sialidase-1
MDIFKAGEGGYHTYRIPSVIVTLKGTVLAFCEGRRHGRGDSGDIDIVLKRSFDGGITWQPMQVIADDGPNTIGNPCPVVDRDTGIIWLLLTHNLGVDAEREILDGTSKGTRTVWVMRSEDDGETWSEPIEITGTTKKSDWTWYATGPGVGIQLRGGRLLIPCDHAVAGTKMYRSHVIYSDDHGESWRLGGVIGDYVNECQAVELFDGTLLMNMRSYHGKNRRAIAFSRDGGLTWSKATLDPTLIEPVCQASILRFTDQRGYHKNRILFSNPASTKRERMTVRLSYDECRSWPVSKTIYDGPSAYSCLTVLPDMSIGCLYERGERSPYEGITFARFSIEWLTEGADSLKPKRMKEEG